MPMHARMHASVLPCKHILARTHAHTCPHASTHASFPLHKPRIIDFLRGSLCNVDGTQKSYVNVCAMQTKLRNRTCISVQRRQNTEIVRGSLCDATGTPKSYVDPRATLTKRNICTRIIAQRIRGAAIVRGSQRTCGKI